MKKKFIGGEYFYYPSIIFKKKKFDLDSYLNKKYLKKYFYFTGGGYYSIFQIVKEIEFEDNQGILLPSYLCPTILIPFKKYHVKYNFYRINENLEIDINDLKKKINKNIKAVFFINYFGVPPKEEVISFLKEIKKKKIILIEDIVHSFFSDIELIGNYCFNSFRKFLPIDGSVIISNKKMKYIHNSQAYTNYFFLKAIGQHLRMVDNELRIFNFSNAFLKLFKSAIENYYKHTNVNFNWYNKYILSRFDINTLKTKRFNNYVNMLKNFKNIALLGEIKDNIVPLGFPIIIHKNRDRLRNYLIHNNVFCPIHWKLTGEINKNKFKESWFLSENILTLPINESVSNAEMKYLIQKVEEHYSCSGN
jgi:dTDP-4-amino-4,6-dideoxygalactose transaminase